MPTSKVPSRVPSLTVRKTFRHSALVLAGSVAALLSAPLAKATTLIWDADTGTTGAQDGSGTWSAGGLTFWDGTANVATADSLTTDIAQFGNGGTLGAVATINVGTQSINGLILGATTTNGYSLTNDSASVLTLGAGNVLMNSGAQATTLGSANLSLALGAAQSWTNNAASLLTVAGNINNGANLLTVAGTGNTTISGVIGSGATVTGGLTKSGAGTLTLSGANLYTGTTTIGGGTVLLSGSGTFGATSSTLSFSAGGTANLGGTSQTLANLAGTSTAASATAVLTNGSLTLSGASNLTVSPSGLLAAAYTLDAGGLSSLTIDKPSNTLVVSGVTGATGTQSATFKLSSTSNTIKVSALGVGTLGTAVSTINSGTLSLGATNAIETGSITIGATRGNGTLSFQSGLTNPTVTLRGAGGGSNRVTSMVVGINGAGSTAGYTGTANFSAGNIDGRFTTITVSQGQSGAPNGPAVSGTFTMGVGTVDATNIVISDNISGGGNANTGNFTQNAGTVTVGTLTLGQRIGTATAPVLTANYNLGTSTTSAILKAQSIVAGAGTVDAASLRNLVWNNGTIQNYDASTDLSINGTGTATSTRLNISLAGTATHAFSVDASRTIALGANTIITGTGALTKEGSGTLTLAAANTFTGAMTINGGTVNLNFAGAINNSATNSVTVNNGSTLSFGASSMWGGYSVTAAPLTTLIVNAGGTVTNSGNFTTPLGAVTLNGATLTNIGGSNVPLLGGYVFKGTITVGGSSASTISGSVNNVLGSGTGIAGAAFNVADATSDANADLTVSTALTNGFSAGSTPQASFLTKSGAGTMVLSGVNTYTGATTVQAGTLNLTGNRTVAASGGFAVGGVAGTAATLGISSGTFNLGTTTVVGNGTGSATMGTINQTGGTLTAAGNQILLGNGGTGLTAGSNAVGTYNLSAGTLNTLASSLGVVLGVNTGTTGNFNLSGTGTLNMAATSTLQITRSDSSAASNVTGTFTQTGGTATVGILQMGGGNGTPTANAGANATLNLTGGTFSAVTFNQLSGADTSSSAINIGGTAVVTLPAFPTARGSGSTATLTFDGGTLRPTASSGAYLGGLTNTFIKAGGATIDTNNANITVTQDLLTDASSTGGALTKAGVGALSLSGANTYTGGTTVSAGVLDYMNLAAKPATGVTTVAAAGSLALGVKEGDPAFYSATDVDNLFAGTFVGNVANVSLNAASGVGIDTTAGDFTYATSQSADRSLSKLGSNKLTLTGANTYTGTTSIYGGTLALSGGDNRLPSTGTVSFAGGIGSSATLDVGSTSQTLASLTVPTGALSSATNVTITGAGGSLTINGASNLQLGPTSVNNSGALMTIDMAGLSNFTYNSPGQEFRVGPQSGGVATATTVNQVATVTLANGSNTISSSLFALADQSLAQNPGKATLNLGTTNVLNADIFNIGSSGRSGATLQFATSLTNPTVKIRGTDGSSPVASFLLGRIANTASTTWTDLVDFSTGGGSVDASVTTMLIGSADAMALLTRQGVVNATYQMGAGTTTVGTLTLGKIANTGGDGTATGTTTGTYSGNGIFNLTNAAGTLNATTINFAENTITANTGTARTASGTLNLLDGTLKATTVQKGLQTGTATSVAAAVNWTTGTIGNRAGGDLTWSGVPIFLSSAADHIFTISATNTATLNSSSVISGTGAGIIKAGPGTLSLGALNTYDGPTVVNEGTLLVGGSISGSTVSVNGGATLGGVGSVGAVNVANGGIVAPGANGVGALTAGDFSLASNSVLKFELGVPDQVGSPANDLLNVGALTLDGTLQVTATAGFGFGTYRLFNYSGALANNTLELEAAFLTANPGSYIDVSVANTVNLVVVPEPSAFLSLLGGLGLLLGLRRRRA